MTNYSNPRMSATIENWPSGSRRVTANFAIRRDPKRGERAERVTTGATKTLTYARKMRIVDGDDGKVYIIALTDYGHVTVKSGVMKFDHETIFERDPRYAEVRALFDVKQD